MAFPTVQTTATTTGPTSNSQSFTANLPSGIQSGDLLLLIIGSDGLNNTTTPTGWTPVVSGGSSAISHATFAKTATGSEGATVAISNQNNEQYSSIAYRISGSTNIVYANYNGVTISANANPPSLTPSSANDYNGSGVGGSQDYLWIAAMVLDGSSSTNASAAPTNYTNFLTANRGGTNGVHVASAQRTLTASTEDPDTFTSASDDWASLTFAIEPGAAPTTVVQDIIGTGIIPFNR